MDIRGLQDARETIDRTGGEYAERLEKKNDTTYLGLLPQRA
ncbi:MAG: hypothetical protein ACLTLQ_08750 [[Clostridium] scindens]